MSGANGNSQKQANIARIGWKRLEIVEMSKITENYWNGWEWLEWLEIA